METLRSQSPQFNPQQSIETAINNIFPLASEENKTLRMRKALGETKSVPPAPLNHSHGNKYK